MYDPVAVDGFIAVHARTGSEEDATEAMVPGPAYAAGVPLAVPAPLSGAAEVAKPFNRLTSGPAVNAVAGASLADAFDIASSVLRKMTPASLCVVFEYQLDSDDLAATLAAGEGEGQILGLRLDLAQSVSGWVVANRRSIMNSDPTLELVGQSRLLARTLRSCLSVPLLYDGVVLGALSLYSTAREAFTDLHLAIAAFVGNELSRAIHNRRQGGGLSKQAPLEQHGDSVRNSQPSVAATLSTGSPQDVALLLVEVDDPSENATSVDGDRTEEMVQQVASLLQGTLRKGDILLRHSCNQLVVLLPGTDSATAQAIASRIGTRVGATLVKVFDNGPATFFARTGVAGLPEDGHSLPELLSAARLRLESGRSIPHGLADSSVH